jgi:hypothetical protein
MEIIFFSNNIEMDTPQKIRVSYTDENDKARIISILPEQVPFYNKWRQTKEEIENGKWKGENRRKAYECLEKCVKKFTYQKTKDEPIICECGCEVIRSQLSRHRGTAKHEKMLEAIATPQEPREPREPAVIKDTDKICECGQVVSKANYARHINGNRHSKYMQNRN